MILAAGFGIRLRPLTLTRPKVLVPVQNRPLLHWLIEYLRRAGAEAVVVNAHHLSTKLVEHVRKVDFDIPVEVRVEEEILGTGGGIRNVEDFWDERPFVVVNGDIFSTINLQEALRSHERSGATATLVLMDEPGFNSVRVAEDGRILSFTGGFGPHLAFTGIHVLDPQALPVIAADAEVSILDCYHKLNATGAKVMAHVVQEEFWREFGTLDSYFRAHQEFFDMNTAPVRGLQVNGKQILHPSALLEPGVRLEGMVSIGEGCHLSEGVVVQRSVLWDKILVKEGCHIQDSIIGDGVVISESVNHEVMVA